MQPQEDVISPKRRGAPPALRIVKEVVTRDPGTTFPQLCSSRSASIRGGPEYRVSVVQYEKATSDKTTATDILYRYNILIL